MIAHIWRYVKSPSFLKISLITKSICAGSSLALFAAESGLLRTDHPRQACCIHSLPFLVTSRVRSTKNWPENSFRLEREQIWRLSERKECTSVSSMSSSRKSKAGQAQGTTKIMQRPGVKAGPRPGGNGPRFPEISAGPAGVLTRAPKAKYQNPFLSFQFVLIFRAPYLVLT